MSPHSHDNHCPVCVRECATTAPGCRRYPAHTLLSLDKLTCLLCTFANKPARYADIYFRIRPSAKKTNYGDVTERLELRKKLDCKPFKYFLDKFFKDKFIPTAEVTAAEGQLKNGENQCIDKMGHQHVGETLGTYGCHGMCTPQHTC